MPGAGAGWADECELLVRKIMRRGFLIDRMNEMSSIELGRDCRTSVVLVISTGNNSVRNVRHSEPGIKEGLYDMAREGVNGKMILYGLGFNFKKIE